MSKHLQPGIRFKLLVFCMLMLAVPALVIGTVSYQTAKTETIALIELDLQHNVHYAALIVTLLNDEVRAGVIRLEDAQEKVKQLLLGPRQSDGTRLINPDIDLGENGYFFVMDVNGLLLAHPRLEGQNIWESQSSDGNYYIQDMIGKAREGGGWTYYDWPLPNAEGEAEKVSYAKLAPEWGWVIGAGSYMMDYDAGQQRILVMLGVTLAICLVLGTALILWFAGRLSGRIRRISALTRQIAEGDLSATELPVDSRDEIGQLAGHFNTMNANLKSLVQQSMSGAEHVGAASQELLAATQETASSARHIADQVQKVAEGMERQAQRSDESAKAMDEMSQGIQRIAATSSTALDMSTDAAEKAGHGSSSITHSVEKINQVRDAFDSLSAVIQGLQKRSEEIGEIVGAITDFAEQTNLLALNASIEAAKAGEQGRGFAVVAGEVKKLAIQSRESAEQIGGMIEGIQQDVQETVRAMGQSRADVNDGVTTLRDSGRMFNEIVGAVQQIVEQVQEASAAAEEMSAGSQQVAASLQEMSSVSAESSASTQSVSAAVEEQLATMEQVQSSAAALTEQAAALQKAVHRFRI